jgi:hypothetical protein
MRRAHLGVGAAMFALCAAAGPASAHDDVKHQRPIKQAAAPNSAASDVGDVAVIADNGLIVTSRNVFDLSFATTIRFEPAGAGKYTVTRSAGVLDAAFGAALTFGYSGATLFPGDDDSQEVAFPAGFPFFGTTWTSLWVNTDGHVTFGAPDFASASRDKARHTLGAPRVSAFMHDWNPGNALNTDPLAQGSVHAAVKTGPSRLVVTWNGVGDWEENGDSRDTASTFQLTLFATGAIAITIADVDVPDYGVIGLAQGGGQGPFTNVDYSTLPSSPTFSAGAIMEAFANQTSVNEVIAVREFYKSHPDQFDFVTMMTDFPESNFWHFDSVRNDTHGIGAILNRNNGQPRAQFATGIYDYSSYFGSAGELEATVFMNNVNNLPANESYFVNPPIEAYKSTSNVIRFFDNFGPPVTFDGQPMSAIRIAGTLPPDDGEVSGLFDRDGAYSFRTFDHMVIMSQEIEHRWGANMRFVHPTKGTGFDSYDLLGRDIQHWSYFVNTAVPASQFPDGPRASAMEGNVIVDLGTPTTYKGAAVSLAAGERLFEIPATAMSDGCTALDQHLMGLRRADEVGSFWYVDEPKSHIDGRDLDPFNPSAPLDPAVTMRGWAPTNGVAFKGKRVDLTIKNIQDWEAIREGKENPKGRRFWGPKGNLKVNYFSSTRRVDPNGDASVTLSEADRELGDEADSIDASGKPVDVKTVAFLLIVKDADFGARSATIARVDAFRRIWQAFANGPATGGRGRFDTSLHPATH